MAADLQQVFDEQVAVEAVQDGGFHHGALLGPGRSGLAKLHPFEAYFRGAEQVAQWDAERLGELQGGGRTGQHLAALIAADRLGTDRMVDGIGQSPKGQAGALAGQFQSFAKHWGASSFVYSLRMKLCFVNIANSVRLAQPDPANSFAPAPIGPHRPETP